MLANDSDPDPGDTVSFSSHDGSSIAHGTLTHNGGGSFTYVPDADYDGSDTFTYTISDAAGATDTATVTITITPANDPPVAGNDAYVTLMDTDLVIAAPGLVGNDGDPDSGDTIILQTTPVSGLGPTHGTVVIDADGLGGFTYTPAAGYTGPDSFTYRVTDGSGATDDGTVSITVGATTPLAMTFYFQKSGPAAAIWNMTTTLAPSEAWLADLDGDGLPGATIGTANAGSGGARKSLFWTTTPATAITLNGPVTLDLRSSAYPGFLSLGGITLEATLYHCTAGGATDPTWPGCVAIASSVSAATPWNTSLLDWSRRSITLGVDNAVIPAGDELRLKLGGVTGRRLLVMMSAAYPTALTVTLGP